MLNITQDDIEAQFLDFMRDNKCEPVGSISLIMDGKIHRYKVTGDKSGDKSGAYCVFAEGWPAGWCQNWRNGAAINWSFNREGLKNPISDSEYKNALAQAKAQQEAIQKQQEAAYIKAAEMSRIQCETLPEAPYVSQHAYAVKKQIYSYGLRYQKDGDLLIVPLRNIDGKIISMQAIDANGGKKFLLGSRTRGAFFSIALDNVQDNTPILLGEGMATMSTIYQLTKLPCVAAMNCHNIRPVAEALKQKFPNSPIIIMADNDHKTEGNPGKSAAEKASAELSLNGVILPEFDDNQSGTDWNDYFILHGEEKSIQRLMPEINYKRLPEEQRTEIDKRRKLNSIVKDLDPRAKIPPQEFIGGMFPRKFVSAIVAQPGIGKTLFMQKFVSDLTVGGSIFNGLTDDEPQRMCLIFAGEAGYELMVRRGAQTKWPIIPSRAKVVDAYDFEINDTSVMLDEAEGWDTIERLIKMYKPDIVFFDSLVSFHNRDENKAVDMKPIIKQLNKLAKNANTAVVLIHHSRKRTAKERTFTLHQDDAVGSGVFNKLIATIIGIEPMKEDDETLLVRPLKNWFKTFSPFTYKITEDFNGETVLQTDMAPAGINNNRLNVWNYLSDTFEKGEWFSRSQIILSEIEGNISERQLRYILSSFVNEGKLQQRGSKKLSEYSR